MLVYVVVCVCIWNLYVDIYEVKTHRWDFERFFLNHHIPILFLTIFLQNIWLGTAQLLSFTDYQILFLLLIYVEIC